MSYIDFDEDSERELKIMFMCMIHIFLLRHHQYRWMKKSAQTMTKLWWNVPLRLKTKWLTLIEGWVSKFLWMCLMCIVKYWKKRWLIVCNRNVKESSNRWRSIGAIDFWLFKEKRPAIRTKISVTESKYFSSKSTESKCSCKCVPLSTP